MACLEALKLIECHRIKAIILPYNHRAIEAFAVSSIFKCVFVESQVTFEDLLAQKSKPNTVLQVLGEKLSLMASNTADVVSKSYGADLQSLVRLFYSHDPSLLPVMSNCCHSD